MSTSSSSKIAWGILSTGAIAKTFARGLGQSQTGRLAAVASREQAKADAFAREWNADKAYGSYEALLADPAVTAVYVSTPHPFHVTWALKAIAAGKHVLVEKPFAVNAADAMAIFEAAETQGVFAMEAFMYRCHPQTAKLVQLIKDGAIGKVSVIQATFSFHAGFNPNGRLWANDYAGGGILDVGCYAASAARLIAGAALGQNYANPLQVSGAGKLHPETGVDEYAVGTLRFEQNIVAQIATGVGVNQENVIRIFGSEGNILVPNPWTADRVNGGTFKIVVNRKGQQPEEVITETTMTAFAMEADVAGRAIAEGKTQAPAPAMSWGDTLGNIKTLDQWRSAIGLTYKQETPAGYRTTTVAGKPLAKAPDAVMTYGKIAGIDKPISRLVMGCDNQQTFAHAALMFDDWFERGGTTFDTAFVYGGGLQERLLGQWIKHRNLREQVVVIAKGVHSPYCYPDIIGVQLSESLGRLQSDYADLYIMHRDNPAVPVGEFVEALNVEVKKGRIKAFGGSNWSLARIAEGNAYAKQKGLQGFSLVSNNFSLARMVDPVWGGCVHSSDAESRAWLKEHNFPLFAWSSQARGFFLEGRAAPDKTDDKELTRCWYAEDNFKRLERANELAKKKGVRPINIALAYVLSQPFPTFALIGPRTLSETRTSLPGLQVKLTPDEVKWLNLEA